jgi:dTDP-4-dehydrorhamnose reductase
MIVGNGMMARAFSSYEMSPEVLVFASGVSDSREKNEAAFHREEYLLREHLAAHNESIFVYFSTCSICDLKLKTSEYVNHKMKMEEIIRSEATKYLIFRLPQAVGKTKSPTLVNYLYNMVWSGQQFEVWTKAYRYLIDCEDAFKICSYIIERRMFMNSTVNVAPPVKIIAPKIVEIIEQVLNKKGNYVLVDKGSECDIDLQDIMPIIKEIGLEFDEGYPERVIRKYYS